MGDNDLGCILFSLFVVQLLGRILFGCVSRPIIWTLADLCLNVMKTMREWHTKGKQGTVRQKSFDNFYPESIYIYIQFLNIHHWTWSLYGLITVQINRLSKNCKLLFYVYSSLLCIILATALVSVKLIVLKRERVFFNPQERACAFR